ncbi:MAG: hypothetical protein KDI43_12860 [Gammaproteobacteria bacterium]|nr:hypothetical protein [Gammaproteobacteria bacterium]
MKFQISDEESRRAKIPHEIFLTNLIGNHILWFIAALGLAKTYWQPLALVPLFSVTLLVYTLWRARQSRRRDSWFVMCHWQLCAGRSRVFILMLTLAVTIATLGWIAHLKLSLMKEAVYAFVGGLGILPIMVTVLVLILMESDALHQAALHKLPDRMTEKYPNPGVPVVAEEMLQD